MSKNIYLARQEGSELYKIGITGKNPLARLKQLQTGNAAAFELVHTFSTNHDFKMETALHAEYATKKILGEWFVLTEDEVNNFLEVCRAKEEIMNLLRSTNPFWMS